MTVSPIDLLPNSQQCQTIQKRTVATLSASQMFGGIAVVSRFFYATTANAQCYDIDFEANLAAGATININADQNTGGAVNLTTMFSINENTFFVTQI